MDDDIDMLLDMVEEKYLTANVKEATGSKNNEASQRKNNTNEELTDLINDICSTTDPPMASHSSIVGNDNFLRTQSINNELKCFPLHLSACNDDTRNQRLCSNLRCINCDLKVIHFDNCEWDLTIDYLFLRNNMPDLAKLRKRLNYQKGCRAYACQCSWKNVNYTIDVDKEPNLKWICGKH